MRTYFKTHSGEDTCNLFEYLCSDPNIKRARKSSEDESHSGNLVVSVIVTITSDGPTDGIESEDACISKNTQWRKVKHMQPVCFEDIFKDTQWKKLNKCNQCNFAYLQAGDLKTHLKIHRKEKSTEQMQSV